MTLTQLWVVFSGRWRTVLAVAASVFLLVMGASASLWFWSPSYTAQATVVLDQRSLDPIANVVVPSSNLTSAMSTQVDVLKSDRVALRAIHALKLEQDAALRQDWQDDTGGRGDFGAWLAERLVKKLDARPGRDSNVMAVKYTAKDPERAAAIVNAFVDAYIDVTLQLRVEPARQYNAMFDERAQQLRAALESAQQRLSAYQRTHGILATDERLDAENQRLTALNNQLVLIQGAAADSGSRRTQAASADMPETLSDSVVAALTAERSRQEATLQQLRERLGDAHPAVVEQKTLVEQLRQREAAQGKRVAGALSANDRVARQRLAAAQAAADEQRTRLLKLNAQRDEAGVLVRDVENAQKAYDAVALRVNQTRIESQNTQTNVSVLQRGTPPPFPSSPNLLINGAAGLLLALLAGAMSALLRELRDQRLRTDDDVRLGLHQPLLGVLPRRRLPDGRTHRPLRDRLLPARAA